MPPTSREKLAARIRNREALAFKRAEASELAAPPETTQEAAQETARATAEAAWAFACENKRRRELAKELRAYVEKPLPRVVEAAVVVKAISTQVLLAELKRRGAL